MDGGEEGIRNCHALGPGGIMYMHHNIFRPLRVW